MEILLKRIQAHPARLLYALVLAVFTTLYLELFHEGVIYYLSGNYTGFLAQSPQTISWHNLALHGLLFFVVYALLFSLAEKLLFWIDRYRYLIAAALLIVCVLLQINGSSMGQWNKLFYSISSEEDLQQLGILWGIPRSIRSDEFAVFTPFCLSQDYNGYNAISSIIRGTATDVTTVYGAPAWALVTLFRPFFWGYLFLGSEYGLSFFWCARFFALALASYECAKLYTGRNLWLSSAAALLISLSPVVLWWFNTNGLVEMMVFGQYAVVLFHRFLTTEKRWVRILCAAALVECAGGFAFTYYPAQEIPFAYVFLMFVIWVAVQTREQWLPHLRECALILGGAILVLLCLVVGIFLFSAEAIQALTSTVYPGSRVLSGGGGSLLDLFAWLKNLLLPIDPDRLAHTNPCEDATFFSLFPCGSLFALLMTFRNRKKDLLLRLLLALQTFFVVFFLIDIPQWLAKLTLMSNVSSSRLPVIIGFLEVALLLRSLSLYKETFHRRVNLFEGIVLSALFTAVACNVFAGITTGFQDVPVYRLLLFLPAILLFLLPLNEDGERGLVGTLLVVLGVSGLCVNPIQQGAPALDLPIVQEIRQITEQDPDGVWLADDNGYPFGNLPLLAGAPCINSTNVYPNLETWYRLDPDRKYESVYNRYSHIWVTLCSGTEQEPEELFSLVSTDYIKLHLTEEAFDLLDVDYLVSPKDYTSDPVWSQKLELLSQRAPFYLYKVTS